MSSWKRTYRVVWTANLVTSIGMMSFLPFFPSLLEELGVEGEAAVARWSGVLFAMAPLTATFSAPLWGAIGDRFGRKLMVCRAMGAIALFVGGMALARSPWELLVLRTAQGLFSGFIPPSITLVSVAAPPDRQGRIAGNLTMALAVGGLCGPLLGGLAATWLGSHQRVFVAVGVLAALSSLLVWFGAEEDATKRRAPATARGLGAVVSATLGDLRQVIANPTLRGAAALVFALQFGLGAINPVLELYVRELFAGVRLEGTVWETLTRAVGADGADLRSRVETLATSLLFGGIAVANLLTLSPWGIYGDRIGHRRALMHCAVLCALALVVQAAAAVYAVLLAGRVLMGVGMAGIGPLAFGLAAGEASADRRGGAFGVVFSARTFAIAVGGTSGGALYTAIGARGLFALSTAGVLVGLWLYARGRGRVEPVRAG